MAITSTPRDAALIDALEAKEHDKFEGTIWRVVREGRDPAQCSASGGRWDDGTFDVLYTALKSDGAIAEMFFHLAKGQPVFPSKLRYSLHELRVSVSDIMTFADVKALEAMGMNTTKYGQLSYENRVQEYPSTQQIAEGAHFLGYKGVQVPNARWPCSNLVLFCDMIEPGDVEVVHDHGLIDWAEWQTHEKP